MNIMIDDKEVFINAANVSTVRDSGDGMHIIKMNNGDEIHLEHYSFIYFRNYSSADWASFSLTNYLKVKGATKEDLSKNKYIAK